MEIHMSNLEQHAESELRRAGLFDSDSDYDGAIGPAVMELVRAFCGKGHSGGSASITLAAFNRVIQWKPLAPITSDPAEWMDVADRGADGSPQVWQNKRCCSCFSNDGGETYYDIDADDDLAIRTAATP
jgi:hypothetical protein